MTNDKAQLWTAYENHQDEFENLGVEGLMRAIFNALYSNDIADLFELIDEEEIYMDELHEEEDEEDEEEED